MESAKGILFTPLFVFLSSSFAVLYSLRRKQDNCGALRRQSLLIREWSAKSQKLAHIHDPLVVLQGDGSYLQDEHGRRYLDSRNNVASIGHQHPIWVSAVCSQVALTNTNARYLHPLRQELVSELSKTLPKSLAMLVFKTQRERS